MLALNKPVLILKEKRLPRPPTDIIGHLWHEFDSFRPTETISEQVSKWVIDIGWDVPAKPIPPATKRFLLRQISQLETRLRTLLEELKIEIDFNADAALAFRQIAMAIATSDIRFLTDGLISEFAAEDRRIAGIVASAQGIAELYQQVVLSPLSDPALQLRDRILRAEAGTNKVVSRYSDFQAQVRSLLGEQ
jgi:hypothetical protein